MSQTAHRGRFRHTPEAMASRPFSWAEYNRDFDARMDALKQSVAEYERLSAEMTAARLSMIRDVSDMLGLDQGEGAQ